MDLGSGFRVPLGLVWGTSASRDPKCARNPGALNKHRLLAAPGLYSSLFSKRQEEVSGFRSSGLGVRVWGLEYRV